MRPAKAAQLILFPEAFVSGYPRGLDFGTRVGSRTPEGREWFRRYWESSVDVPGPATEVLGDAARQANAHLVIGVIERDGGTLYCSVLFFAPDGTLMGKHRKLMPTAAERAGVGLWRRLDHAGLRNADRPARGRDLLGKLHAALADAHVLARVFRSTALPRPTTARPGYRRCGTSRSRADASCSVATSSLAAPTTRTTIPRSREMIPATIMSRGGSCIIDPLGQILAGPDFDGPTILVADLDLDEIPRAKFDFDVVGHYARPDVFRARRRRTAESAYRAYRRPAE